MNRFAIRTALGLALLGGAAYGCSDFLVAPPQGALNEQTLTNSDGVEAALVGAYRMLGGGVNFGSAPSNWALASVPSDDAYKGSDPTDQGPQINPLEFYEWLNGPDYLTEKWDAMYAGISRANSTLNLLKQVQEAGGISETDAKSIQGEALFLRANFHFELWEVFGNVPYYTEEDTDFREPNLSSEEVIQNVLADLDAAIALLPNSPRNGEAGRASVWTAKAVKGRVQVYSGDYAGGKTTLQDVVDNGPYALEPSFDRVWTGFQDAENGPETILVYEASANSGDPNGDPSNFGERLNFPHSGSPFGCCGFHQPSQNLVNFFKVDPATGLPLALAQGDLQPLDAHGAWNKSDAEFDASHMEPVDPRLDWTVGRDGVPYKDWGTHEAGWIRDPAYSGPYSPKKNVHEQSSGAQSNVGWTNTQLNSVNIHIFRYADLLLLLAEAKVEGGDLAGAMDLVNQVRARAAVKVQGCGLPADQDAAAAEIKKYPDCAGDSRIAVPIDDPSIKWANYKVGLYTSFPSQDYARTAVRYERRLELAMEGHRLFDLQRWGTFKDVLNAYVDVEKTRRAQLGNAVQVVDKHQWYPIPPDEIELSKVDGKPQIIQNEGWD
jgi:hypothetical protein